MCACVFVCDVFQRNHFEQVSCMCVCVCVCVCLCVYCFYVNHFVSFALRSFRRTTLNRSLVCLCVCVCVCVRSSLCVSVCVCDVFMRTTFCLSLCPPPLPPLVHCPPLSLASSTPVCWSVTPHRCVGVCGCSMWLCVAVWLCIVTMISTMLLTCAHLSPHRCVALQCVVAVLLQCEAMCGCV